MAYQVAAQIRPWWVKLILPTDAEKLRARLHRELKKECRYYGKEIIDTLTRIGFVHRLPKDETNREKGQKPKKQFVKFDLMVANEDSLWLRVNMRKLPFGTKAVDFEEPYIERELSLSCQRAIRVYATLDRGLWIQVVRDGAVAGIPKHFDFKTSFQLIRETDRMTFVAGISEGRKLIHTTLPEAKHILVGGVSGAGKSRWLNAVLVTLLARNAPSELELYLVDFKGGLEFSAYRGAPHVKEFATNPTEGLDLLEALVQNMEEREKLIKKSGSTNLEEHNKKMRKRDFRQLSNLVLVIDELAEIMNQKNRKHATDLLRSLVQKGRALGIRIIAATQTPNRDLIDPIVKNNFELRMAFNCSSYAHSMVIIDRGDAAGLEPQGRAIFWKHGKFIHVQAPFITDGQVKSFVRKLIAKYEENPDIPKPVPPELSDIIRYAVDNLNGELAYRKLHQAMSAKLSEIAIRKQLKRLDSMGTITIDDRTFQIIRANGGSKSRRLIEIDLPDRAGLISDRILPARPLNIIKPRTNAAMPRSMRQENEDSLAPVSKNLTALPGQVTE